MDGKVDIVRPWSPDTHLNGGNHFFPVGGYHNDFPRTSGRRFVTLHINSSADLRVWLMTTECSVRPIIPITCLDRLIGPDIFSVLKY